VQAVELDVLGAEVVPPLGHAVRLVDGEQRRLDPLQQAEETLRQQPLRGDVEQVQLAVEQPLLHGLLLIGISEEFRKAARTPSWRSASTWSCISAISGETTMPVPGRSSAGIW
jgi:hypothetical protein